MMRPGGWGRIVLWVVLGATILADAIRELGRVGDWGIIRRPQEWIVYTSAAGVVLMALVALAVTLMRRWPQVAARRRFQATPTDNRHLVAFTIFFVASSLPFLVRPPAALEYFLEYYWYLLGYLGAPIALVWMWLRGSFRATLGRDWGLHSGTNLFVEVGWGLIGYAACWCLWKTFALTVPSSWSVSPEWMRPTWLFLMLVYAPVVEETFFRGALYRELRRTLRWFGAAVVVAVAFTFIHSLWFRGWPAVGVLFIHGFVLCVLREWRDSLVAPMVTHLAWNGLPKLVGLLFPGVVI